MLAILLSGFGAGLSLILAIGAQNAYVLRMGLNGHHVALVVAICAVSDAVLIAAGVAGMGALVTVFPWFVDVMRIAGAAFLGSYAVLAARRALRASGSLTAAQATPTRMQAIVTALVLTWANPHVYLDTLALLGMLAQTSPAPWVFGAGAITASFAFFSTLGFGARFLRPIFATPRAWRVLDGLIACVMGLLAIGLIRGIGG